MRLIFYLRGVKIYFEEKLGTYLESSLSTRVVASQIGKFPIKP